MGRKSNETLLKEALAAGDFTKVAELSAKIAKSKKKKPIDVSDIQINISEEDDIIDLEVLDDDDVVDLTGDSLQTPHQKTPPSKVDSSKNKQARREPMNLIKNRPNLFTDDFSAAKQDLKSKNKNLAKLYTEGHKPTGEKMKKAKVKCHVCNKIEIVPLSMVPPVLGGERAVYRCDSCCSNR